MPGTWQAVVVIAVLIVPGYMLWWMLNLHTGIRMRSGWVGLIQLVALGTFSTMVGAAILLAGRAYIINPMLAPSPGPDQITAGLTESFSIAFVQANVWPILAVAVVWCFVLPVALGTLLARAVRRYHGDWLTSWDALFTRGGDVPLWLHVYLDDAEATVYEGLTWRVSAFPDPNALTLKYVKRKNSATAWEDIYADYVYVSGRQIKCIEAFEPAEPE